jgi:hypothetical protein
VRQQKQAIRVANVTAPVLEEMVEREKPATVTELAAPSIEHHSRQQTSSA